VPNIVWTSSFIQSLITNSNGNLNTLNAAELAIKNASTLDTVTTAVLPILPPNVFDDPKTMGSTTAGLSTTSSLTMQTTVLKTQQIMSPTQSASIPASSVINAMAPYANSTIGFPGGVTATVPCGFLCLGAPTNQQIIAPGTSMKGSDFINFVIQGFTLPAGLSPFAGGSIGFPGGVTAQVPTPATVCANVTTNASSNSSANPFFGGNQNNASANTGSLNSPTDNISGLKSFFNYLQSIYSTPSCPINLQNAFAEFPNS
jgi:hypothetical protein